MHKIVHVVLLLTKSALIAVTDGGAFFIRFFRTFSPSFAPFFWPPEPPWVEMEVVSR